MAINPIIAMTLGYAGVVLLAFLVINFLQAGFLRVFMIVKGSRGKKIMTNIYAVNRNYVKAGFVDNGWYVYSDGNGHEKRMKIPSKIAIFYRFLNVTWVNVDEESNCFITPDGKTVTGHDAIKTNDLYKRALMSHAILDPRTQIQFFLTIVTVGLLVVVIGILGFVVIKKLDLILANTEVMRQYFIGLNSSSPVV